MFDLLQGFRVAELSTIKPGELFLMSDPKLPRLALRVTDPNETRPIKPAVVLHPDRHPEYVRFEPAVQTFGLVIGRCAVRVLHPTQAFARNDSHEVPGALILGSNGGAYLIAGGASGEVRIDLRTGALARFPGEKWFVKSWEFGIENETGEFTSVFTWAAPSVSVSSLQA